MGTIGGSASWYDAIAYLDTVEPVHALIREPGMDKGMQDYWDEENPDPTITPYLWIKTYGDWTGECGGGMDYSSW
jgi:hypothetical protein